MDNIHWLPNCQCTNEYCFLRIRPAHSSLAHICLKEPIPKTSWRFHKVIESYGLKTAPNQNSSATREYRRFTLGSIQLFYIIIYSTMDPDSSFTKNSCYYFIARPVDRTIWISLQQNCVLPILRHCPRICNCQDTNKRPLQEHWPWTRKCIQLQFILLCSIFSNKNSNKL